jgi:hypothetical protein
MTQRDEEKQEKQKLWFERNCGGFATRGSGQ